MCWLVLLCMSVITNHLYAGLSVFLSLTFLGHKGKENEHACNECS